MDRREFLRIGAAGASGLVLAGGPSDASLPKRPAGSPQPEPLPDMDRYLALVDSGMDHISRWSPTSQYAASVPDREAADGLARKSLRTLYLTAMFAQLPEAGQLHPGMQQRVTDALPEMDEAASEMVDFLSRQTPEDLGRLQRALKDPRNPAMEIFEGLDREAGRFGVSRRRRLHTRAIMTEVNWRLRNQPPALVIDECLQKVRKVTATDVAAQSREDWAAAHVGEQLFWESQEAGADTAAEVTPADSVSQTPPAGAAPTDMAHRVPSRREKRIAGGAKLMGIGLVTGGVTYGLIAAGILPGVFLGTVGAVLFLIGLVKLIVGLCTGGDSQPAK